MKVKVWLATGVPGYTDPPPALAGPSPEEPHFQKRVRWQRTAIGRADIQTRCETGRQQHQPPLRELLALATRLADEIVSFRGRAGRPTPSGYRANSYTRTKGCFHVRYQLQN